MQRAAALGRAIRLRISRILAEMRCERKTMPLQSVTKLPGVSQTCQ